MSKDELLKELKALHIPASKIENSIGMPSGLSFYFRNPSRLPNKWVDKLTSYLHTVKNREGVIKENVDLKNKVQALEKEVLQLNKELARLRAAADSWNELIASHEKKNKHH